MKTMTKNALVVSIFIMLLGTGLQGCQSTMRGAGEDIENMGEWIQDRAP